MPLSFVAWEGLHNKLWIRKEKNIEINLSNDINNIELFRDYDYTIKGIIKSVSKINPYEDMKPPGSFLPPFDFEINDYKSNLSYELKNCFIKNSLFDKHSYSEKNTEISIGNIKKIYNNKLNPVWRIEWFLNGPKNNIFAKYMQRELKKEYLSQSEIQFENEICDSGCFSFQIYNNSKKINIIVHSVPHPIEPLWSSKIGVAYKIEDKFPKFEEREAISEILGFIIGRELINVGYSDFDTSEQIVEDYFRSPEVRYPLDIRKISDTPDSPPVKINDHIKDNLFNLIPKYLELREELNLNYLLYRYWTAQLLVVEAGIPIFGAALEDLVKRYKKTSESKYNEEYVSKKEYKHQLNQELKNIKEKLKHFEYNNKIKNPAEKIYNNVSTAYQMSGTDKIKLFFDEISLDIGEIENKAIIARHRFAHGEHIKTDKQFENEIHCSEAYKTLFNRILLKLLGFEGKYIDYYTLKFPEKPLDEPIDNVID